MANKYSVTDHGDLKKYYVAIPNIVFTLGLSPHELVLYVYLKKVAGEDGICWKSTATIAKELNMGAGTVSRTKPLLAKPREGIGGKPLIAIASEMQNGGNANHVISITDIWPENMAELERVRRGKATRSTQEGATSCVERARSTDEGDAFHTGTKEEPYKKTPIRKPHEEERQQHAKTRADTRGTRLPDDFCLNSEMREWAAKSVPHVDLSLALAEFVDYWRGVPGMRGRKLDWLGTWRNRMRELEGRAGRNGRGQPSKVDNSMAAVRQVLEEYEHGN